MTKWPTTVLLAIFLGGLGRTTAQEKPGGDQKPDADRIVGTWRISKSLIDGKELPADVAARARFTFTKDGKASMRTLDKGSEGKYKLVAPGKIDIALDAAKAAGLGIYKFDGDDRLTLCVPRDAQAKERPTEFTGAKDSGQVLFTLTRAKPGEEKP
jgi:uncharacterized protein (TIGR03067 family)